MIVATRLSAVWQVAGVAAAALCCYLVSQSVASERAQLLRVDQQIADAHNQIASLQMEIGVRARMGQLESWNRDVLALQAPRPAQFVGSGVQLASLYGRRGAPALQLDPAVASQQGAPDMVAYQVPAPAPAPVRSLAAPIPAPGATEPSAPQSLLHSATYVRPVRLGGQSDLAAAIHQVAYRTASGPAVAIVPTLKAAATDVAAAHSGKAVAKQAQSRSLLPSDIGLLAAREAKGTNGQ